MTITRRALFATSAAAAILIRDAASAQSISVPKPEELWAVLKGEPQDFQRMLASVDALTRILVLRIFQMKGPVQPNLNQWFEIRRRFEMPILMAQIEQFVYTSEAAQIITKAGEEVRPTTIRIEKALAEGGLVSGSELEKDMLRGFIMFVQLKAVADRKAVHAKQAWYCDVYPFSWFCSAAG